MLGCLKYIRYSTLNSADTKDILFLSDALGEKGVRLAQKMHVGPCTPAGTRLQKAGVGPTSAATRRHAHFGDELRCAARQLQRRRVLGGAGHAAGRVAVAVVRAGLGFGRIVGSEIEAPNMLANLV